MGISIFVSAVPLKAAPPRYCSELDKVTFASLLQSTKARLSIEVTLSGIVTDVRLIQPENAEFPIDVRLLEKDTERRLIQFANVPLPIAVTEFGILIVSKEMQHSSALFSIVFTPEPKVTELRRRQWLNALV